jgi:hypothetical protein
MADPTMHVSFHRYYRAKNFRRVTRWHNRASVNAIPRWQVAGWQHRARRCPCAPPPPGGATPRRAANRRVGGQHCANGCAIEQESGPRLLQRPTRISLFRATIQ